MASLTYLDITNNFLTDESVPNILSPLVPDVKRTHDRRSQGTRPEAAYLKIFDLTLYKLATKQKEKLRLRSRGLAVAFLILEYRLLSNQSWLGYISLKYLDRHVKDLTSVMAADDQKGKVKPLPAL